MNRIILVGNGFDLAHDLKTSYADFINWYWERWGQKLLCCHDSKMADDELCSFKIKKGLDYPSIGYLWGYYYRRTNIFEPWNLLDVSDTARQDDRVFKFEYKNQFFNDICNSIETKGWVDIENIYYEYLSHKSTIAIDAKVVNDDLDFLCDNLITYLTQIEQSITPDVLKDSIKRLLFKPFEENDFAVNSNINWQSFIKKRVDYDEYRWVGLMSDYFNKNDTITYNHHHIMNFISKYKSNGGSCVGAIIPQMFLIPDRTMLLSFNYTKTADIYMSNSPGVLINHIHGELSKPESIIFGYGDELDENYKTIENTNNNEYLRIIKSMKYLESPNYRELLKFIESDEYQIFIMGHSCGNSDRTLLNTLFEHKNCVSIKPFYHKKDNGTDNYIELIQNISRNFNDKNLMRDRVVNKTFCEPLS